MFFLYAIEDKILLKNTEMNADLSFEEVVLKHIRGKYIGKILLNHGIVLTVKKLIIKQSLIIEIEGILNVEYQSELVVFKPVKGDLLFGKIINSDESGLIVDCQLVKVYIPRIYLMSPMELDEVDNVWYWNYKDVKLYYDIGEEVKCSVLEVNFKSKNEIANLSRNEDLAAQEKVEFSYENIMEVICCMNLEGLGPINWWT